MSSHDALPDAILELVFLGLDTSICLHRAASTCRRWRHIITGTAFRALQSAPPVVAGCYYNEAAFVRPRFEPSPSAASVDGRHFSLDFLPGGNHCKWLIKDTRGSLVLLVRRNRRTSREDLIVCEPLTRRHEVVPPPPMAPPAFYWGAMAILLAGDVDSRGGGITTGMSKFKVLYLVHHNHPTSSIRAHLFTSGGGGSSWRLSRIDRLPSPLTFVGIATGRQYWHDGKKVLALDQSTLEFSSFVLPWNSLTVTFDVALTVGRDGEARIAVGDGNGIEGNKNLKIFARVQGSGADGEKWEVEKTVQLSAAMLGLPRLGYFYLSCNLYLPVEAGKLKVRVPSPAPGPGMPMWWWFRLDMETMEAERMREQVKDYVPDYRKAYPFEFPWPSLLRACCTHDNDKA